MTRRPSAPMPTELRRSMRAGQHPARSVPCPHCGAAAHKPCRVPSRDRILAQPHPQRISAWARQTACCPQCQVEPTIACHDEGRPRHTIHNRRYQEAEETAA
ncbi:hypothetical protein GCM10010274_46480 [Streptomyces lavendofoliae]|uniref:DNA-binding phage zinc finger domain-containing protein n=2 Tax=Streptomyces lavendofoliae TaxID=67314 RepID=A0A918I2D6_9ACTN|nr:hypothetical protein GCM10010274_46480 [Streptomyces lavendofoliae]